MIRSSDLTVVIPTIIRDSIVSAIESIDIKCNVLVILDNKFKDKCIDLDNLLSKVDKTKFESFNIDISDNHGPGKVKFDGIDKVKTEYFIILDDDDEFVNGYLPMAIDILSKYKPDWIASHYDKDPGELNQSFFTVQPVEFSKYYFNTDEYHRKLEFIYPGSEVICNTSRFRYLIQTNQDYRYHLDYLDDVIPMTMFMSNTYGLLHKGIGIKYGLNDNTVSHNLEEPYKIPGFKSVVEFICEMLTTWDLSKDERKLWRRVLTNLIDVSYFNFTFSKGVNKA